jgi:hypothetical protein
MHVFNNSDSVANGKKRNVEHFTHMHEDFHCKKLTLSSITNPFQKWDARVLQLFLQC